MAVYSNLVARGIDKVFLKEILGRIRNLEGKNCEIYQHIVASILNFNVCLANGY